MTYIGRLGVNKVLVSDETGKVTAATSTYAGGLKVTPSYLGPLMTLPGPVYLGLGNVTGSLTLYSSNPLSSEGVGQTTLFQVDLTSSGSTSFYLADPFGGGGLGNSVEIYDLDVSVVGVRAEAGGNAPRAAWMQKVESTWWYDNAGPIVELGTNTKSTPKSTGTVSGLAVDVVLDGVSGRPVVQVTPPTNGWGDWTWSAFIRKTFRGWQPVFVP